ncbi:hypothetical protein UlMin_035887 [Ulmus minor]
MECPVCLENYDGDDTIPRVLACGHSVCEACLSKLPQRFPQTIRCPACTQLVNYPPQGPSFLPKNIDLLSLCLSQNPNPSSSDSQKTRKIPDKGRFYDFLPQFWSEEFYLAWKDWVLPNDAIDVETEVEEDGTNGFFTVSCGKARVCFGEDQKVSLVRVVRLPCLDDLNFEFSYVGRVMKCLSGMSEGEKSELGLIFRASVRQSRKIGKVYGLWGNLKDGFLYLVCERRDGSFLEKLGENGSFLSKYGISGLAMIGVEMIEAVISLHREGFVAGCLGLSCFCFDEFGHVYIDLNEALVSGRKVRKSIADAVCGRMSIDIDDEELGVAFSNLMKDNAFVSPELLLELLHREGIALERYKSRYSIRFSSDICSLAYLLLSLFLGKAFNEEIPKMIAENGSDYVTWCSNWIESVRSLLETELGSEYTSLKDILLQCLVYDPGSRPLLTEVRRCIKELIFEPQFDLDGSLKEAVDVNCGICIILSELCHLPKEMSKARKEDELKGREASGEGDCGQVNAENADKNFVESLSEGKVKVKDLQGHRDCISGIAVGGGFLFSSSLDKTICVWSLQDFSHVHTFKGHEHKVMALAYVVREQPLCISGDSGGGIFVWSPSVPLRQEPLKKWYEEKDWRYSGIHALCFSDNGLIYTGGGDKLIKAWSLLDGNLSCTMDGHKSVVSALAVCEKVLYSGSWDGTIRLWSLIDHTPLTVLGGDTSGAITSVLSLAFDRQMLLAAYENGCIKFWRNDVFMKSMQLHEGAIFATGMEGKWLFTGGWDKTINVQELSEDELHIDARTIGSVPCGSAITTLLFWEGKLYVGFADRLVKVYYFGK